jgi:phosphoesterase RecJ-like protein
MSRSSVDLGPWLDAVPAGLVERLGQARRVVVATHENPDADTLGAAIGIAAIVEAQGGAAVVACADPVPPLYAFLPGMDRFTSEPDAAWADLIVIVDCGSLDRVGALRARLEAPDTHAARVIVDHHASNADGGPDDWIDPQAAATCELVGLLAVACGVRLDAPGLAAPLMAGIVMDTATFAHPNATPRTLAVSAALVEAGAPLAEISRRLYRSKPDEQLRLFGRVLHRLETAAGGRIVHSSLTAEDHAATGTAPAHSEGIIDLLSQSEAADVVILFKEASPTTTRISVRTRVGGPDATALTGAFGGGGHARAAGATVSAPLDRARTLVLAEAERLLAARPAAG